MEALCIGCAKSCRSYAGLQRHQDKCKSFHLRNLQLRDEGEQTTEYYDIQHAIHFSNAENARPNDRACSWEPLPGVEGIEDFHDDQDPISMVQSADAIDDTIAGCDSQECLDGLVPDSNEGAG
jgi:hypothetical protein